MVQAADRKPLLELRELAPTEFVRIYGETYDVIDLDSLGIRQRTILAAHFERVAAIEKLGPEATDDDDREYGSRLEELLRVIMPSLPSEVLARIPRGKRAEIAGAFFVWAQQRSPLADLLTRLLSVSSSPASPSATAPASGS